jgi:hypothetical protein
MTTILPSREKIFKKCENRAVAMNSDESIQKRLCRFHCIQDIYVLGFIRGDFDRTAFSFALSSRVCIEKHNVQIRKSGFSGRLARSRGSEDGEDEYYVVYW